jgi:adenylate cyclase
VGDDISAAFPPGTRYVVLPDCSRTSSGGLNRLQPPNKNAAVIATPGKIRFTRSQFASILMKHKKGHEIERKFLIKRLPVQILHSRHFPLRQGYLANEPRGRHVRLRKKGKAMSLTFKVSRGGPSREEREIRLSKKQFATLWPATKGRRLSKTRYEIPWKRLKIEVDIYHGRNHGLMVAEVEFPNHSSRRKFKPPRWFGREVTGEKRYSNVRLARE